MIAGTETRTLAVVGNPNCGKTTLFNGLTGSRQRIGNWPGVTVEKKEGFFNLESLGSFLAAPYLPEHAHTETAHAASLPANGSQVTLVDLPGIYSLSAGSDDERVARDFVLSGQPDLVINILDASNLQRNLYLTVQLLEMRVPVLVILNMMDLAHARGIAIDTRRLAAGLGCPVVAVSANTREGVTVVKQAIAQALDPSELPPLSALIIDYPAEIETVIGRWAPRCSGAAGVTGCDPRWVAVKLVEQDPYVVSRVVAADVIDREQLERELAEVHRSLGDDLDVVVADARYNAILGLSAATTQVHPTRESVTDRIDRVVMNRFAGIPIFLGVMYLVFWLTITIGEAFIDFFEILFGAFFVTGPTVLLEGIAAPAWVISLLANGIGAGIQTVATFIPIIFMMFLMLSLLEDSGYMARAAFVMDRFMRLIGLPGKSFVPMMVGFGCTVPAIMGTRTLESTKDRFMTIFMAPFMSCGARLPVYALFAAAFFPAYAGQVVFSLYVVGITLAILTGLLLKKTLFRGEASHFIMELPPYHAPRPLQILGSAASRLGVFILRAGSVIVVVVAVLGFLNSLGLDGSFGNEDTGQSVLGAVGKGVTPVFGPMGITDENWPATLGLFTGLFAKEVVIGTLNSLYAQDAPDATDEPSGEFNLFDEIAEAFASIVEGLEGAAEALFDPLGLRLIGRDEHSLADQVGAETGIFARMRERFTPAAAYAYLLFILIYTPCAAAVAAAVREMGHAYAWLMAGYQLVLAWGVSVLFFQMVAARQLLWIGVSAGALIVLIAGFAAIATLRGEFVSREAL